MSLCSLHLSFFSFSSLSLFFPSFTSLALLSHSVSHPLLPSNSSNSNSRPSIADTFGTPPKVEDELTALRLEALRDDLFPTDTPVQNGEINLSIAALQSIQESLSLPHSSVEDVVRGVGEKIENVIYLLKKYQVDHAKHHSHTWHLKELVRDQYLEHGKEIGNLEDREVAQWISERVFTPSELNTYSMVRQESALDYISTTSRTTSSTASLNRNRRVGSGSVKHFGTLVPDEMKRYGNGRSRSQIRRRSTPVLNMEPPRSGSFSSNNIDRTRESGRVERERPNKINETHSMISSSSSLTLSASMNLLEASQDSEGDIFSTDMEDEDHYTARVQISLMGEETLQILQDVSSWDFDVFAFCDSVQGHLPLVCLSTHIFTKLDLFDHFNIPKRTFVNFMTRIEETYIASNPYHNAIHGADVLQNLFAFINKESFSKSISSLDILVALVAGAVHDVGHPGTNNQYQVATRSDLAVLYNDRSVLENHHVAETFRIMNEPGCDILSGLTDEQRKEARETMIVMVLATDMSQHLEVVSSMQTAIATKKEANESFHSDSREDASICLQMALHCADVANPTKPLSLYSQWVDRITKEWYIQGDMEREAGLPVSPLMDREKPNVAKSQVGFIDFFIRPLFETWVKVVPESQECLDHVIRNRMHYLSLSSSSSSSTSSSSTSSSTAAPAAAGSAQGDEKKEEK